MTPGTRAGGAVVVGVDGSPGAVAAARIAAREATLRRAPLELLMAVPRTDARRHPDQAGDRLRTAFRSVAGLAAQAAAGAAAAAGTTRLRTRVVDGDPVGALVRAGTSAALLCVGRRPPGPLHVLLGSVAATLAATAPCPVLVVPQQHGRSVDPRAGVVVGIAGGPADATALAEAFAAAAARSTELVAVHAWPAHPLPGTASSSADPRSREAGRRRAEALVEDALAPCRASWPQVPVRRVVLHGPAVAALTGAALTAELVVVGRPDGSGVRLGSVSRALLRAAPCPVLVVPAAADRPGGQRP